ncbi:MAG: S41 family peptidase [Clostridiales bacterium]|jgi:carboxyl-terminal processing protease|nr:S41 family peptidase [Clostridiales bacterium]
MKDNKIYHFFTPDSELPYNEGEPSDERVSEQSKPPAHLFWSGAVVGMLLLAAAFFMFTQVRSVYNRITRQPLTVDEKISEIMGVLDSHSINPYEQDELRENMFRGLVAGVGDPYTTYFDEKSLNSFMQSTEGTYGGIGVVVTSDPKDKLVTIVTAYEGAPGALSGLKTGDKFMKVNGLDVSDASLDDVTTMTKGQAGTAVRITVYRASEDRTFDVNVVRQKIDIPTISQKVLEGNIGYIRISAFDRVTVDQFVSAYNELHDGGMRGLIIDLRNNPGGLLDVVTKISDILVPEGIIVYTEDKSGLREYINSDKNAISVPLVLLVNGNSASASEVLSGAVKDLNVGVLVGTKTFGKGIVQNLYPLSDGSAVKVTVAKYYTPSGVCIQGDGIIPDYVVEMSDEDTARISELTLEEDAQLSKAVEIVNEKIAKK